MRKIAKKVIVPSIQVVKMGGEVKLTAPCRRPIVHDRSFSEVKWRLVYGGWQSASRRIIE